MAGVARVKKENIANQQKEKRVEGRAVVMQDTIGEGTFLWGGL